MSLHAEHPTFHSDREGVCGAAVYVSGFTSVLPVVILGDVVKAKPVVVVVGLAARLFQAAILLSPFHLGRWSAEMEKKSRETGRERTDQAISDWGAMEEIRVEWLRTILLTMWNLVSELRENYKESPFVVMEKDSLGKRKH